MHFYVDGACKKTAESKDSQLLLLKVLGKKVCTTLMQLGSLDMSNLIFAECHRNSIFKKMNVIF